MFVNLIFILKWVCRGAAESWKHIIRRTLSKVVWIVKCPPRTWKRDIGGVLEHETCMLSNPHVALCQTTLIFCSCCTCWPFQQSAPPGRYSQSCSCNNCSSFRSSCSSLHCTALHCTLLHNVCKQHLCIVTKYIYSSIASKYSTLHSHSMHFQANTYSITPVTSYFA